MSTALQIAHTDLTGAQKVTATNKVLPAKRPVIIPHSQKL